MSGTRDEGARPVGPRRSATAAPERKLELCEDRLALERWVGEGGSPGDPFDLLASIERELVLLPEPLAFSADSSSPTGQAVTDR